ncbi:hypothetical protein GF371_00585 [Candidatus Woesearchaeota archaeon]|nr:hypothetical protein [Candidatus Woesearchaeota archaeon]
MKKLLLLFIVLILMISIIGCVPRQKNTAIVIDKDTGEEFTHEEFYNSLQGITGAAVAEAEKEEIKQEMIVEQTEQTDTEQTEKETGETEQQEEEQQEQPEQTANTNERVADHYERMRRYAGLIDLNILNKDNCDEKRVEWQQKLEKEEENLLDLQEEINILEISYENKKDLVESAIQDYEEALEDGDEDLIESKDDDVKEARAEMDKVEDELDDKEDEYDEKEDYIDEIDKTLDLIKDECVRLS